jgi:hypothetical protein
MPWKWLQKAVELRKKASMLAKLELQVIDQEAKGNSYPIENDIRKETFTRLQLGVLGLDTFIALYLGEPVASHLPMLPMGRMKDDFEEEQDWTPYRSQW